MTRIRTPSPALSARQVDRVEKEVLQAKIRVNDVRLRIDRQLIRLQKKLTRLLASVRRSERR